VIPVPATVSGRPVTARGVHGPATGFHGVMMDSVEYWQRLLSDMGMSWYVALSESDALYASGFAEALLDAGVIPIVRFAYTFPGPWVELESVEELANLYAKYDAQLIIQFANEPFDEREWKNKDIPPDDEAWAIIDQRFNEMAQAVTERGAIAGFPDGPCYADNPFMRTHSSEWVWHGGKGIYLCHNYGKGRPIDYPRDDVSRFGTALSYDEYVAALDDYGTDSDWNECLKEGGYVWLEFMDMVNAQRATWADPDKTAVEDDTCFHGYEKTLAFSREAFGFEVPMMMAEGGWVPRDRAGSGPTDIRWPMTTPRMVAQKTLKMYGADTPFLAICPWLLANSLGGSSGWESDAWVSTAYPEYGTVLPVVQALKNSAAPNVEAAKREIESCREGGERVLAMLI